MDISIVIPVFNNQETIKPLCLKIMEEVIHLNIEWEIIIVNDASRDGSAAIIDEIVASTQKIRSIHLPKNLGQNMW